MFVENPDMTTLRQGDIVTDVLFPLVRMDRAVVFLGTYGEKSGELEPIIEETRRTRYQLAQLHAASVTAAVLSQDCDVDQRQRNPPPAFLLCRVMRVPESIIKSQWSTNLRENVNPYGESRPYYQFFYLGPLPERDGEFLADYSQIMTISWTDYGRVLKKKFMQLQDIERSKFRVKAGAHVGRPSDEEITARIADPWRGDEDTLRGPAPFGQRLSRAWRVIRGIE